VFFFGAKNNINKDNNSNNYNSNNKLPFSFNTSSTPVSAAGISASSS